MRLDPFPHDLKKGPINFDFKADPQMISDFMLSEKGTPHRYELDILEDGANCTVSVKLVGRQIMGSFQCTNVMRMKEWTSTGDGFQMGGQFQCGYSVS